jgi:hypothetical protein
MARFDPFHAPRPCPCVARGHGGPCRSETPRLRPAARRARRSRIRAACM